MQEFSCASLGDSTSAGVLSARAELNLHSSSEGTVGGLFRWTAVNLGCILDDHFNSLLPVACADTYGE